MDWLSELLELPRDIVEVAQLDELGGELGGPLLVARGGVVLRVLDQLADLAHVGREVVRVSDHPATRTRRSSVTIARKTP